MLDYQAVSDGIIQKLFHGLEVKAAQMDDPSIIEITPIGDFVTYEVGVSMMEMRNTEKASGQVGGGWVKKQVEGKVPSHLVDFSYLIAVCFN